MKKEIVKYFVDKHKISGYGYLINPKELAQNSILDFLCDWSKDKKVRIFSYSLEKTEENFHKYKKKHVFQDLKIPYCDWVYYLDIYYQNE